MENTNQKIMETLEKKYPMFLTKKDLAEIMSCSLSSINNLLKDSANAPKRIKFANTKNSSVRFLNSDVADFLADLNEGNSNE